jgi:hypothetical protein
MDTIMLVHDVMSEDECNAIIKYAPRAVEFYKDTANFTKSPNDINRQDTQYDPYFVFETMRKEERVDDMFPKINSILGNAIEAYSNKFPIIKDQHMRQGVHFSQFKLQKTPIGGGFHDWHCEDIVLRERFLVWSLYLNDISEGGETEFLYKNVRVPAKQGCLCLFPSDWTHIHRGNPPISNEKWMLTGWYTYNYRVLT